VAKLKTVGERHWTHGPLILGSGKLHAAWNKAFTEADAKPLKKLKKASGIAQLEGESVVFLNQEETGVVPWDGAAVLVHAKETTGYFLERDRIKIIASIDPKTIAATAWKPLGEISLGKDAVLFDVHCHDPNAKSERKTALPLGLPAGDYVVEVAKGSATAKPYPSKVVPCAYHFVRLRPPDWVQTSTAKAAAIVDEGPVVASPEVIAATKKYPMATADGIPMVIAPKLHMPAWTGGGGDYDRACDVNGVASIKIGKGQGLVISEPGGTSFWPTDDGGLLVIWVGADSMTACIAAALTIPEKQWKKTKAKLTVAKDARTFVIFNSYARGTELKPNGKIGFEDDTTATFELAAGSYAIDTCWNWEAEVKVGKKIEETMVAAIRLRR
jgi:hypothetical protein